MNRQDAENYFPPKTTKAFERGLEGLEMVAPRAGLEPATSRLQVPQFFNRAWTISSPAYRKSRGGCRALLRHYWTGSSASSLCTVLPTRRPFGRLRSGFPFRFVEESGQASLNSPEVSTTVSRGGCNATAGCSTNWATGEFGPAETSAF